MTHQQSRGSLPEEERQAHARAALPHTAYFFPFYFPESLAGISAWPQRPGTNCNIACTSLSIPTATDVGQTDCRPARSSKTARWMCEMDLNPNCKHHCDGARPGHRSPNSGFRHPLTVITPVGVLASEMVFTSHFTRGRKPTAAEAAVSRSLRRALSMADSRWPLTCDSRVSAHSCVISDNRILRGYAAMLPPPASCSLRMILLANVILMFKKRA